MTKKKLSAEQRTLSLKEQLLTEELVVTEEFVQAVISDVGVPMDQSDINDVYKVRVTVNYINNITVAEDSIGPSTAAKRQRR